MEYMDATTSGALVIKELLSQRKSSTTEKLMTQAAQVTEATPGLIRVELKGGTKLPSTGGRKAFIEDVVRFGYYEFATGGPKAYKALVNNSKGELPSLAKVRKYGQGKPSINEGELQIEWVKNALALRGLPSAVWLSEDDTKLASVLKYNSKSNEIIGLDLPIGDDGLPITGSYKFTSVKTAMTHIKNNPMSAYLKLVACRVLQKDAYKFIILAYGTSSGGVGGQTAGVKMRWKTISDALNCAGIKVYGEL